MGRMKQTKQQYAKLWRKRHFATRYTLVTMLEITFDHRPVPTDMLVKYRKQETRKVL